MENTDKNFEEEWRKAFDGAEEEPSALLWQGLENKLAEKELILYKKKYFYLRAAASVLLFLFTSTSLFYVYHYTQENLVAHNIENSKAQNSKFAKKTSPNSNASNKNVPNENIIEEHKVMKNDNNYVQNNNKARSSRLNIQKQEKTIHHSHKGPERSSPSGISKRIKENNENEAIDGIKDEALFTAEEKSSDFERKNTVVPPFDTAPSNAISKSNNRDFNFISAVNPITPKDQDLIDLQLKTIYIARRPIIKEELYLTSNSKKDKKSGKRWYASYAYTPTYTNQNFERVSSKNIVMSNTQSFGSRKADVEAINMDNSAQELEAISPQYSWNTGINGGYKITEKLVVEMGVNYAYTESKVHTNYFVKDNNTQNQYPAFNTVLKEYPSEEKTIGFFNSLYSEMDATNGSGAIPTNESDLKTARIYTQYVGVPITISYKLIDKKINVFIGGGISTDFFLEYGSKENASDGFEKETVKSNETTTFKPVGLSFLINPQIEYEMNSRYSFYLRPIYKAAINSYTDTKRISNKPTSTGLGFGLKYNFN